MEKFLKNSDRKIFNVIGYYQIIGGIVGIGLSIYSIITKTNIPTINYIFFIVAFVLYSFCLTSGLFLLKEKLEKGIKLTLINQILQSIQFSISGYSFIFVGLINVFVGIDYTNDFLFKLDFTLTKYLFTISQKNEVIVVGLNLIPILILFYIKKIETRIKLEKELLEESQEVSV